MKKLLFTISIVLLGLMLSGWGSKGHRKISQNMAACLPPELTFLKPAWTDFVGSHASDADYRKDQDPNESPRHYIDIDNYPVFLLTGVIPHYYDSVILQFGYNFVIDQGTLPWTTLITFDSLKSCFERGDWNRSALYAADLGHYVGDGHMPLHITRNYNGQFTGQTNIHTRYESTMISKYESQLVYPADAAEYVGDVRSYIFNYLYQDYRYVDSVLLADSQATLFAGSNSSNTYYQALWDRSGTFTKLLMQRGSKRLADLIYTAWVQAGSPAMYPNGQDDLENPDELGLQQVFPNPAREMVHLSVVAVQKHTAARLQVFNLYGKLVESMEGVELAPGNNTIDLDVSAFSAGTYFCRLTSGNAVSARRFTVIR